jgi:hypothetical protein
MKKIFIILSLVLFISSAIKSQSSDSIDKKFSAGLNRIGEIHEKVRDLFKALNRLQPIAIAENDSFYIFDIDSSFAYKFIKKIPCTFSIPMGIRAAMPLEGYDFKSVCVVTPDALESAEEAVIIFHEFIHCYQFQTIEMQLKKELEINEEEMKKNNFMWEISYKFPYENEKFVLYYTEFLNAIERKDKNGIKVSRESLKNTLTGKEYEYMVWEEWKEGYARYAENCMRSFFGFGLNNFGIEKPFSRITFYCGGSKYIEYLIEEGSSSKDDLELLYKFIKGS